MPQCQLHQLGFTLPQGLTAADLPQLVADLFGVQDLDPQAVRQPAGRHGYAEYYALQGEHGAELISILLRPGSKRSPNTSHITVHGHALETGDLDVQHICRQIVARNGWGSDVHLAADDTDGVLPWPEIIECSAADQWEHRITTTSCRPRLDRKTGEIVPSPPTYLRSTGETIYYGQQDSDLSVCMYTQRGPIRVETRIRSRAGATGVIQRIAAGEDIGAITAGILRRALKFHEPGPRRKDRRPVCTWWEAFLGAVEPIKLPRHRDTRHKSPWYVPPTRAQRVVRFVSRQLRGDDTDAPVMDAIRGIVADADARQQIAEEWNNPESGNRPYDYVPPNSSELDKLLESLASGASMDDVSPISSDLSQFSTRAFDPRTIDIDNIQFD